MTDSAESDTGVAGCASGVEDAGVTEDTGVMEDTEGAGPVPGAGVASVIGSNVDVISPRFGTSRSGISRCWMPCQAPVASSPSRALFVCDSIRSCLFVSLRRNGKCRDSAATSLTRPNPSNHAARRTVHQLARFMHSPLFRSECTRFGGRSTHSDQFPPSMRRSHDPKSHIHIA